MIILNFLDEVSHKIFIPVKLELNVVFMCVFFISQRLLGQVAEM